MNKSIFNSVGRRILVMTLFVLAPLFGPAASSAQIDPLIGEIVMFAGNFAPRGWAFCEGQLLPISQNTALFSILGTTYGGDGVTTFALPDLRGRVPIQPGNGPGLSSYQLGQKGGNESSQLSISQIPAHTHNVAVTVNVPANSTEGNSASPVANYIAKSGDGRPDFASETDKSSLATPEVGVTQSSVGGNQSHSNVQPYTAINYIIALQGIYPSRN